MLKLLALRVTKIEPVDTQLVGHGDVHVVGHALCDPVVPPNGLEPPNLINVGKRDAVHLIGAVFLEQGAQTLDPLASRPDVWQDQGNKVLLTQTAGTGGDVALFALNAAGWGIHNQRVGAQNAFVAGDGLGSAHANVELVESRCRPNAVALYGIWNRRVAHGLLGKIDGEVRFHAGIDARLIFGQDHLHALGLKLPTRRVLIASDDCRTVIARIFSYKDCGARHDSS